MSIRRHSMAVALAMLASMPAAQTPAREPELERDDPPETTRERWDRMNSEARAYRSEKPTGRAAQRRLRKLAGATP